MISSSAYPTIPLVIPLYRSLENHLKAAMSNLKLSAAIRGAIAMGHVKLLKYKAKAMSNQYYVIATGLSSLSLSISIDF